MSINKLPSHDYKTIKKDDMLVYKLIDDDGEIEYAFIAKTISSKQDDILVVDVFNLLDYYKLNTSNEYILDNRHLIAQNLGKIDIDNILELPFFNESLYKHTDIYF